MSETVDYKFHMIASIDVYSMAIITRYVLFRMLGGDEDLRLNFQDLIEKCDDDKIVDFVRDVMEITEVCYGFP
jgi:hypothetical protein